MQMATGLGKCFAPGTMIRMHDGSKKPVEQIKEGDLVMGADGKSRMVVGLAHGQEEMFEVRPTNGEPYTVNRSHILSLKITNMGKSKRVTDCNGNKYSGGDICNISVDDYLKCSDTFKHVAKGWRVGVDYPERDVDIPPYILGLWLGDGTSRNTTITTSDPEVVRECAGYCRLNDMRMVVCGHQNAGKAITYSLRGKGTEHGCNRLRNAIKKYNLLNNKHIPSCYLINSRKVRLELLAGLLDTDGYLVDGNVFEIVTALKEMANGILELSRSLGFAAHNSEKIVNGKIYYRINISGDTHLIPTRVERRKASKRKQKKDVLVTGIKVKSAGVGEYYGFELLGKDKLFLLSDFTVVHNTVTFANIPRRGRMLILSHREELVRQPLKYFSCRTGVEQASNHALPSDDVVSASVQSMSRRLRRFDPDEFDIIVWDEAHHCAAKSYRNIFGHFHPRLNLGFTATPNRSDNVRMDDIFSDIIFQRDLKWGIQNNYLSDIFCRRVDIGYDLSAVRSRGGDYAPGELDEAMDGTADAIAEVYDTMAEGATLIFAVSVHQAEEIAKRIDGAVVVTGETKDRAEIIRKFTDGEIPCIVNVMVFTEGTDIPRVETVIIARPTQSDSLYTQMVGRGLRLFPGKERLNLIDCVGVTGKASLCTAPSLLGIDLTDVPVERAEEIQGLLFELPDKAVAAADCPESWIKNVQIVDLWAKAQKYNTHKINWFKMPTGDMICSLPGGKRMTIPCPDELGRTRIGGRLVPMQQAFDRAYMCLTEHYEDVRYIWDLDVAKKWGKSPASDKQINLIRKMAKKYKFDPMNLTKGEASQVLNRLMCGKGRAS